VCARRGSDADTAGEHSNVHRATVYVYELVDGEVKVEKTLYDKAAAAAAE
jgi:hypothetical protein